MKKYFKEIDGKIICKIKQQIVITKDDVNIFNPTEQMLLEDGWQEYVTPEKTIEDYRNEKINMLLSYDKSSAVNEFFIQGIAIWLDKSTRVGLKLRFESELNLGKEETTLWYMGAKFSLPLENAIKMLFAVELYASECYDNTQYHISQISQLTTIEEIQNYDYMTGYPDKLKS